MAGEQNNDCPPLPRLSAIIYVFSTSKDIILLIRELAEAIIFLRLSSWVVSIFSLIVSVKRSMACFFSSSDIFSFAIITAVRLAMSSSPLAFAASYRSSSALRRAWDSSRSWLRISVRLSVPALSPLSFLIVLRISSADIGLLNTFISTFSTKACCANGLSPSGSAPSEDTDFSTVFASSGITVIFKSFVPVSLR